LQILASKMPNWQLLHATSDCIRPPLLGRGNCYITRRGIGPLWLSEKIRTVSFMIFL